MKKNITIKDVAREAGVSIATVSYVINERTDKCISDKTRKKVLQIVNLLNYVPNQSAKALATQKNNSIAIYVSPDFSVLKNAEQLHFINLLSSFLRKNNYDLIYLNDAYTEKFDHADAILCFDISSEQFHRIGDNNFIPLLALNCIVSDPISIFFQLNPDYEKISLQAENHFGQGDFTLLLLDSPNQERKEYLNSLFQHIIYVKDIPDISLLPSRNYLVIEHTLYHCLNNHTNVYYHEMLTAENALTLLSCIETAIAHTPVEVHDIRL